MGKNAHNINMYCFFKKNIVIFAIFILKYIIFFMLKCQRL